MRSRNRFTRRARRLPARSTPFALRVICIACLALSVCWRPNEAPCGPLRVATYNASLNRSSAGRLISDLSTPNNLPARRVAEVVQQVRPDILLINEFDYDANGDAARLFQENYLSIGQNTTGVVTAPPIDYPFRFVAPSNTGVSSGVDFDGNGSTDDYGFGNFPGQFGMAVYSRFPVLISQSRTFQTFLWKDMPGHRIPANYTQDGIDNARLSSKSHWDLSIDVDGQRVHLLASHPTPPVFDSPVFDENGRRNADEIRFWTDYIDPASSGYIYDDMGVIGGLSDGDRFVVVGDFNSDPFDGDSLPGAADQLLDSPLVNTSLVPASAGGVEDSILEGGINDTHLGDPAHDTADFAAPGNLRVDYALPSANMTLLGGGVFWPTRDNPLAAPAFGASDHRLVFVDISVPEPPAGTLVWLALALAAWPNRRFLQGGRRTRLSSPSRSIGSGSDERTR